MVAEYLVQSLKENLDDLEERYGLLNAEYKRNYRDCNLLQRNHERFKKEYQLLEQSVKTKCELIEQNGLTISNQLKFGGESNGIVQHDQLYVQDSLFVNQNNILNVNTATGGLKSTANKSDEIKQNGYHKGYREDGLVNKVNNSPLNHKIKCNGQLDDLSTTTTTTNGYGSNNSGSELTNGYIKTNLPNGLNNSFHSSVHHSNHHTSSSNNDKRTDLSSSHSSTNDKTSCSSASLIFSEELYQLLTYIEGKTLNDKINFLLHDKINKLKRIKALRSGLDDEKIKSIKLESLSLINGKQLNGDLHRRVNQSKFNELSLLNDLLVIFGSSDIICLIRFMKI